MADKGTDAGTDKGADAGTGSGMTGRMETAMRPEVARLAAEHGFGEVRSSHLLGGGNAGCAGFLLGFVLFLPGLGLVVGPVPAAVTSIGVILLVLAVAAPIVGFRLESVRDHLIHRMYIYDGGLIIIRRGRIAAHPWHAIRVAERLDTSTAGQNLTQATFTRLELRDAATLEVLVTMGGDDTMYQIRRLAEAARTPRAPEADDRTDAAAPRVTSTDQ